MDLSMAIIKADILMAEQGIELYNAKGIKEIKNQVAYHLQQAIEKLIKIQIYKSGCSYDNKSLYIHNIGSLISYASGLGICFNVPKEIEENSVLISDWEASGRYDIHFTVRIDTLIKYYNIVVEWYSSLYKIGIR